MSNEESLEARQNYELEALQAIYGEELKDLRKKAAWNRWTPLNLCVSLTPQQGSSGLQNIYVKIDLHVICSAKYPNSPPTIKLENSKGLSNTLVNELLKELTEKAADLKGEEMIFQLCQHVEEFLHRYNKPTSESFYDEMLKRQKEKEEMVLLEENRQRQSMIEEVQRRQEILKSELKGRKITNSESTEEESLSQHQFFYKKQNGEIVDDLCDHHGTEYICFGNRKILRGRCLSHQSKNRVVYAGLDTTTGEMLIIAEWIIELTNENDPLQLQRQLTSIEQEINYLTKLKHQNLAHYISIKHETIENKLIVKVLREYVNGIHCKTLLFYQNATSDVEFVKYIARGTLQALDYLHRNNVVHKGIESSCIYVNDKGIVKVNNYSINKRLSDLINPPLHINYGKKTDIYDFALFILSLLKGGSINDDNIEISASIPLEFNDLLSKCFVKDEKERSTASQLLNHPLFRKHSIPQSPARNIEQIDIGKNISPEVTQNDFLVSLQSQVNGQSRINNEFEFLQHLGKGAFGDVIKVRNKLDGGYYAIKRIQLNPKNRQLNKKIVREVKLLSRLNHENVVRYYNSWIETTTIKGDEIDISSNSTSQATNIPKIVRHDEFTINDNIEALAPSIKNVEVSITYDSKSQAAFDSSEDDSSDDESGWGVYSEESESDGIEFERDTSESTSKSTSESQIISNATSATNESQERVKQIDFMYIQMEFCEKSTLRTAIDNKLFLDEGRVWRLFREIVEGLAHIHQQGMIHRDLKPVNIFLDSEDHVKIGDFGLATTNIKSKQNDFGLTKSAIESEKDETINDESKTGVVGTALYVAPEIGSGSKSIYNQKVDIYSLGIILFEMCYKPLETNMERIKILLGLRNKEIILPDDFVNKKNTRQEFLIKWLLNHDVSKRPTSQELLQSEHVPPPVLEECELRELVRHTLSNPQLKSYKYLIGSCFQQSSLSPAQDITYDKDPSMPINAKPLQLYEYVKQKTIQVFKNHSGQNLATPLLMPKGRHYEGLESCVKLMTHFGSIVTLPYDLRVPFARYVAWNGITLLRRYSIERVYREKKVFGFLPRELYECAFDIITPTPGANLMSDAEILYIVYEIINNLPAISNKHFLIRLNHALLIKSILIYCGIKDRHDDVLNNLKQIAEIKESKMMSKYEMQNYFISLGLPDNNINMLINFFSTEFEISKVTNYFQMITKKKTGEASQMAKTALKDLRTIAQTAETFGVTYDIVIAPGLFYNVQQYSGMICQFVCELKRKHKHGNMEVLAAGGRYDSMIKSFRNVIEQATMLSLDTQQSGVGISISLDKLVQAIQKENEEMPKCDNLDVVVCSVGIKPLLKEKSQLLKRLWSLGIRYVLIEASSVEEIQAQVNELKVAHVIMLKDNEQGTVRVRSSINDKLQEKKYPLLVLLENIENILNISASVTNNSVQSPSASRTDCKSFNDRAEQETIVEIVFVTVEKLSANARKRYANQIRSQLDSFFKRLNGHVTVIVLNIESNVIKTLASYLEFESEYQYQKSVGYVIEKHQKHKKYLNDICDKIFEIKNKQTGPIIVLYSLNDYFYNLII